MFNGMIGDRNSLEDQQRDIERSLMKANRDNELERKRLLEEEEKIENEIRTNTELGNSDICRILAKQLVDIRRQKARAFAANNKINALIYQHRANCAHNSTINSTQSMAPNNSSNMYGYLPSSNLNNLYNVNPRLNMINDALDDMLIESDDEDDFIEDNYDNAGNNFNSRVTPAVTNDQNTNSAKEPNTANTTNATNTTNKAKSLKAGNTTTKTKRAATATNKSPATRQFGNRANKRPSHLDGKTKSS